MSPHPDIDAILGTWSVTTIEFADCPVGKSNSTIEMGDSNCFTSSDDIELCISMSIQFDSDGMLTQSFVTYEDGIVVENKVEKSRYTIAENKITICNLEGTSCETSRIDLDDGKLMIKGRDVSNKCYILLKSTK